MEFNPYIYIHERYRTKAILSILYSLTSLLCMTSPILKRFLDDVIVIAYTHSELTKLKKEEMLLMQSYRHGRTITQYREIRQFDELQGPSGVYQLPIVGLPLQLKPFTAHNINRFDKMVWDYKQMYGDIFKMRLGFDWHVFLCDPDDFERLYRIEGRLPHRPMLPILKVYFDKKKLSPTLFALNGEQWAKIRSPVQRSLRRVENVSRFLPRLCSVADDWIELIKNNGGIIDVSNQCMRYTLEGSGSLCFNTRFGCIDQVQSQTTKDFIDTVLAFFKIFGESFFAFPWYNWVYTKTFRQFEALLDALVALADEHILKVMHKLENGETDVGDSLILDLMTSPDMTQEMTARNLVDLFIGGVDSSAQSLCFLLYHLAANPEQQEILFSELESVLPPRGTVSSDQLKQLPYLRACFKESSRLIFPVVGAPVRCFDKDVTIGGFNIPRGTIITCVTCTVGKDERYFSNPEKFSPERWLTQEEKQDRRHPFSHRPFGLGLKSCVGQRFAEQEIFIGTAKMVRNFKLSLQAGMEEMPYVYKTFATPAKTFNVNIERR